MSRAVPSQVVSLINSIFPNIPRGLEFTHAPYLAAIINLADKIPHELITLDEDELKKLGYDKPKEVGSTCDFKARGIVSRTSEYVNEDGRDVSMSIQITDMEITNVDNPGEDASKKLYGD